MLNHLQQQLRQHLPRQRDFLIGLSGGVDSVVLLHLFAQLPDLNLRAVHIHHGLSPNADQWADFCESLCQDYRIPLITEKVNVCGNHGLEANARTARYQAIGNLIQPNEVLATAHHLDDQVETFFLALKRGSGLKGLSAMQAVGNWQHFAIFRPLLEREKADLIAYAEQQALHWINDESNGDNRFDRNFLRNQILPALNQRFPQFSQQVAHSATHCREQQALIEELLGEELQKRIGDKQQLDISGFARFSPLKQKQLVRLWLAKCGVAMPSQAQLQAVIDELIFAKSDKNPQVKLGDKIIRRYRQAVFVTEQVAEIGKVVVEIPPCPPLQKRGVCSSNVETDDTVPPFLEGGEYSLNVETDHGLAPPFHKRGRGGISRILSIHRTPTDLICTFSGKTYRLLLPIELHDQPLTLKIGVRGRVREYGKPHSEEMKKIWQKHDVPTWEREHTPLLFRRGELVAVLVR